jgi:hypothetical protein
MFVKVWCWEGVGKRKAFLNTDYIADAYPTNGRCSEVHMSDGRAVKVDNDSFDTLMTAIEHECGLIFGEPAKGQDWKEWMASEKRNWGDPKC